MNCNDCDCSGKGPSADENIINMLVNQQQQKDKTDKYPLILTIAKRDMHSAFRQYSECTLTGVM